MTMLHRSLFPVALRGALLALSLCAFGAAQAQQIDDVPPAVQNNVPPNFMFMIDNSGSMNNVVVAAPYSRTATYLNGSCPRLVPGGSVVSAAVSSLTTTCVTPWRSRRSMKMTPLRRAGGRMPGEWLMNVPQGMSLWDAMAFGTAEFPGGGRGAISNRASAWLIAARTVDSWKGLVTR